MELSTAYKLVLDDLMKSHLLCGIYDAENSSETFMSGVGTVMEVIALRASEEDYFKFNEMFMKNIQKSVDKRAEK